MSCAEPVRELLTFWVAGSLSPDEAALVAQHVESCADCRQAAVDGVALVKGLRDLHLAPEEVAATAAGELHLSHPLVCARCRDEVALLRGVNADLAALPAAPSVVPVVVPVRAPLRAPARHWRPLALTALAASVALLAFFLAPRRAGDDPTALRGRPSAAVDLHAATIGADGVPVFAWTPVAAATRYRVGVFSEDGRPIFSRDVAAPPLRWPSEVARGPGAYRWRIEALAGDAVVARSHLAELEIPR